MSYLLGGTPGVVAPVPVVPATKDFNLLKQASLIVGEIERKLKVILIQ